MAAMFVQNLPARQAVWALMTAMKAKKIQSKTADILQQKTQSIVKYCKVSKFHERRRY
jgi:hypothetical protein